MYHGQPQPRALPHGFGGEEGLKDALQGCGGNTGAVVLYGDDQVVAQCQAQAVTQALLRQAQRCFHADQSTRFAQRMHGVGGEVKQRLLHLCGVGQHARQIVGDIHLQLNCRRQRHAQQTLGIAHDFMGMHGIAFGGLIAAEGQNLAYQVSGAAACFFNFEQAL